MPTSNIDLIFEKWKASLRDKPKSREHVGSNFDELFDELNSAGATFEEARAYLQPAIKVHLPPAPIARSTWKQVRTNPAYSDMTEKEFVEGWHKDISDQATNSFYHIFPLPEEQDTDSEPKVYGSMSAKEYRAQRRHAESYPILNTEELERKLQSGIYDPLKDILGEEGNDGDSN